LVNKIVKIQILQKEDFSRLLIAVVLIAVAVGVSMFSGNAENDDVATPGAASEDTLADGTILAVEWGDLGVRMVEAGVIDHEKFVSLYESRGGLSDESLALLADTDNGQLEINEENANVVLNLLWAFGLSNKNSVLEEGPMMDEKYGGADRFASTGGWSLAKGNVMDHYGAYAFVTLTADQQKLVEGVSKNIYRPCCNNSTYFPDCNHGMAMLGLLELMAAQGASEDELYEAALVANRYWFPSTYATLDTFFAEEGISPDEISAKEMLGAEFSSASGYRNVLAKVKPQIGGGASCGV